jgi:hypothetical protein
MLKPYGMIVFSWLAGLFNGAASSLNDDCDVLRL